VSQRVVGEPEAPAKGVDVKAAIVKVFRCRPFTEVGVAPAAGV
jgi:hypothetical protein